MDDDDLDFPDDLEDKTDDEIIAYFMGRHGISREQAAQNWREACGEVRAAAGALFAALAGGEIEATGINIETGKRETIPPHVFEDHQDG